jgi:putative ABC transport system permease protein
MFAIAIRSMTAAKRRLAATISAVVLGIGFLAGTFVLTDTARGTFDDLFADVYAGVDVIVRGPSVVDGSDEYDTGRKLLYSDNVTVVANTPGVAQAVGISQGYAQPLDSNGDIIGGRGAPSFGYSWNDTALNPYQLAEGTAPVKPDDIVVDIATARNGKLTIGGPVDVVTAAGVETYQLTGTARFGTADSAAGSSSVLFTAETAQRVLAEPGKINTIGVIGDPGTDDIELAEQIEQTLKQAGIDAEVLTGAEITAETQNALGDVLDAFGTFLLVFAAIALFVASFMIYNTFSILVAQRGREIAMLRAIGASRRQMIGTVLIEAVAVGTFASIIGLGAGIAIAIGLKAAFAALGVAIPGTGVVIANRTIIVSIVLGVATTVTSAVVPALRAARIAPLAALRDVAYDKTATSKKRTVGGAALAVMAATLLTAGLNGTGEQAALLIGTSFLTSFAALATLGPLLVRPLIRTVTAPLRAMRILDPIAYENSVRNPARTSITALALTVGVGIIAAILVMAASVKGSVAATVDTQLKADYLVVGAGFGPGRFPTALGEQLGALDTVTQWSPLRAGPANIGGDDTVIIGVNAASITDLIDFGNIEGDLDGMGEGDVAIGAEKARTANLAVGDTVTLQAPGRAGTLRVAAIYDADIPRADYFADLAEFDRSIPEALDVQVYISATDGFAQQAEAVLDSYPTAELQDRTEFKQSVAGQLDAIVNIIYVLLLLAVFIAFLGIANTLSLSIFERRREIGLLRAIGMTRPQLRSSLRWEAALISATGTATGLALGSLYSAAIVAALADSGFSTFIYPVGQLATICVAAALLGVASSANPARRAAKLPILASLAEH